MYYADFAVDFTLDIECTIGNPLHAYFFMWNFCVTRGSGFESPIHMYCKLSRICEAKSAIPAHDQGPSICHIDLI